MNLRWLLFASSAVTASALAQGPVPALDVARCAGLDGAELGQLLSVELATVHGEGDVSALEVECGAGTVEVHAVRANERILAFTLQGVASDALARLLALRISEWLSTQPVRPPPPPPPAPPVDRPTSPDVPPAHHVALVAEVARVADPATWLSGVAASADVALVSHLWVRVDAGFSAGRADTALAGVRVRDLHAVAGLFTGVDSTHADLRAGVGLRAAYAWLSAERVEEGHLGRTLGAPWGGPALSLGLTLHGSLPLAGVFGAELGWVTLPARGLVDGEAKLFALEGEWLALRAGAAYRF